MVRLPTKIKSRESHIASRVYDILKEAGETVHSYPALMKRIKDWLKLEEDEDKVELVIISLAKEDPSNFTAVMSLNPLSFEYMQLKLGVPKGAWKYALWLESVTDNQIKFSGEHWLGIWKDQEDYDHGSYSTILYCRDMLDKLIMYELQKSLEEGN